MVLALKTNKMIVLDINAWKFDTSTIDYAVTDMKVIDDFIIAR
jgi:hypothetical protein